MTIILFIIFTLGTLYYHLKNDTHMMTMCGILMLLNYLVASGGN